MTNMERFRLVTKNQLNPEQRQLFDLVLAAGITIHPEIFKWVMEYYPVKAIQKYCIAAYTYPVHSYFF